MTGLKGKIASGLVAMALASSAALLPANAEMTNREKRAVAGIIALGVAGAILADRHHREGRDRYEAHPAYHPTENAVGVCVHRAKQIAKRQGAYRLQVTSIERVRELDDGSMRVVFYATGYYETAARTSKVRCTVWGEDVIDFDWT